MPPANSLVIENSFLGRLLVIDAASVLASPFEILHSGEPSVENCGSPTLRFGERFGFSLFLPRHFTAWPAAFQITIENNAESSLFELRRDVLGKNFQSSMPFVWFLVFISFYQCGITGSSRGASLATERQIDDASLEVTVIVCGFDYLELLAAVL